MGKYYIQICCKTRAGGCPSIGVFCPGGGFWRDDFVQGFCPFPLQSVILREHCECWPWYSCTQGWNFTALTCFLSSSAAATVTSWWRHYDVSGTNKELPAWRHELTAASWCWTAGNRGSNRRRTGDGVPDKLLQTVCFSIFTANYPKPCIVVHFATIT